MAGAGESVLLIDLDPQGNASTGLGVVHGERTAGSYGLLMQQDFVDDAASPTGIENLAIIPADSDLAGAEIELVGIERREFRLRDCLASARTERSHIRFIFIDCPPGLNLLTLNALVAADAVLVPLQCEFFALEGITQITRTIDLVRRSSTAGCACKELC